MCRLRVVYMLNARETRMLSSSYAFIILENVAKGKDEEEEEEKEEEEEEAEE